ncbi:tetratricopeptide repeat protein 8-like [Clavelina lepadiformis]|uniref:tetratricopeptide repeat protein 8-like n=1 Tax=Clavelina lepadiformis TaxID=159417 RepID=UPI0040421D9F
MMDPMFIALSKYRRRKYGECVENCTQILDKNPYDQAAWALKAKALTQQVYIDEIESEEQGIAEMLMDDTSIAQFARPGTSLKQPTSASIGGPSPAVRPVSQAGRPLSGFVRPGTQSGRPGTMEQALKTPRTAQTARPVTSASGRFVRLGTASMLSHPDGPFINLQRLNYGKYAAKPNLAKVLFEYIFHHENDVRNALELAAQATGCAQYKDWWWKLQVGKCYHRLGMFREAERQYKSALKQQVMLDTVLLLGKVYLRLDQPLQAVALYKQSLEKFPNDTTLLVAISRIYDGMNMIEDTTKWYKEVLISDGVNIEAIASIAANYFYTDQPEVAIRLYRRLIQMGLYNVELFNNIGLCCFYAQHYDMTLKCFERAVAIATDEQLADVWYNISHLALGVGDNNMAYQCLRLAVAADNGHTEAYNNLAVLELRRGDVERAKALFRSSAELNPLAYEPHYNQATLSESLGDLQTSYSSVLKSVEAFPDHVDSKNLLVKLKEHFASL